MDKFYHEETVDKPMVLIDLEKPVLKIKGSSYPENAANFYHSIIDWISERKDKISGELECEFFYNYINSASKKSVFDLLSLLEKLHKNGIKLYIKWNYDVYDDDMYEMGKEFLDMTELPYRLISHE